MTDVADALPKKIQKLSDVELAILLCLIANEHCIIRADPNQQGRLALELGLVCSNTFGLRHTILECSEHTTLDGFTNGMLIEDDEPSYFQTGPAKSREESGYAAGSAIQGIRMSARSPNAQSPQVNRSIANVVVVSNLDKANHSVQTQALELIRSKRIFTRKEVHIAPKRFMLIALLSPEPDARLTPLLNDHMFISHKHEDEDGFPNLESSSDEGIMRQKPKGKVLFPAEDVDTLKHLETGVRLSPEIRGYLHNVVVFARMHRAVGGGVTALATRNLNTLARALAPLHGLSYVSPSLVALAARKVYPHRIIITAPENERSMQWGSSLDAVKEMLDGVTPEDVIEEVLQAVEVPL